MNLTIRSQALLPGTMLDEWIVSDSTGGRGGARFYLARRRGIGAEAILQEYFPARLVRRLPDGSVEPKSAETEQDFETGRDNFLAAAAALRSLTCDKPQAGLPRVLSIFQCQGTAYLAMERDEGKTLTSELEAGRRFDEDDLLRIFKPIIAALRKLHAMGVHHLAIRPSAVILSGETAILNEFATLCAPESLAEDDDPYSPIELIVPVVAAGPWSDIYGLGATLYHCITREPPPPSAVRIGDVTFTPAHRERFSTSLLGAVAAALSCVPGQRPQSIDKWLESLPAAWSAPDEPAPEPHLPEAVTMQGKGWIALREPVHESNVEEPKRLTFDWRPLLPYVTRPALGLAVGFAAVHLILTMTDSRQGEAPIRVQGLPVADFGLAPKANQASDSSAPLLLLTQEITAARTAVKAIDAQVRQALNQRWPQERVAALQQEAQRASAALSELESLHAAPTGRMPRESFVTALEAQSKIVRAAQSASWQITLNGYVEGAERRAMGAQANYRTLKNLVAGAGFAKPALLQDTADLAHGRLQDALENIKETAALAPSADPIVAGQRLAQVVASYNQIDAEASLLRDALRAGRRLAAAAAAEAKAIARDRKTFLAALQAARVAASELEAVAQPAAQARDGGEARLAEKSSSNAQEAKSRLDTLEKSVLRTPDAERARVQIATAEARELEKALRSVLNEVRSQGLAPPPAPNLSRAVLRLIKKADERLTRNYKRFQRFQDVFAEQGNMRPTKAMDSIQKDLNKLAAMRERLAGAKNEKEAERLYKQFQKEHEAVDGALDRMQWSLMDDAR